MTQTAAELLDGKVIAYLAGILVLLALLVVSRGPSISREGKPLRNAPNTLPIAGNGLLFLQARQKLFAWFTNCERLYPGETLRISVPSLPPGVLISSPANLDYVFKNEGTIFEKGHFFTSRSWDLFGNGIINVDGPLWKKQRKAGLAFLSASNLKVLTDVALPRYLEQSVEVLERCGRDGREVDLQMVVLELTSQLMGKMAYNLQMHADDEFTVAFDYASGATAERFQNPLWQLTERFLNRGMRRSLSIVKRYGTNIVAQAGAGKGETSEEKGDKESRLKDTSGSLIQSLLSSLEDETLVADAALNFLSAGRDTVAQALTWTLYLLMKHPSKAETLRKAVHDLETSEGGKSQESNGGDSRSHHPEMLTPSRLPYATAVFYESLRLYPPIPFELKQAQRDCTLPDGTFLPAKSVVLWCAWAMNRSHTAWGPDADIFKPERWFSNPSSDDSQPQVIHKTPAEFPVFNGGSRLCLGKSMAEKVALQVLATLVTRFDFEPAFEGERVSKISLTLPMEGGLPAFVKNRV